MPHTCGMQAGSKQGVKITLHGAAHAFVGASMINSTSPNDPAFYMLHAFTDALWMSWQVCSCMRGSFLCVVSAVL